MTFILFQLLMSPYEHSSSFFALCMSLLLDFEHCLLCRALPFLASSAGQTLF